MNAGFARKIGLLCCIALLSTLPGHAGNQISVQSENLQPVSTLSPRSLIDSNYMLIVKSGILDKAGNLWFATTWEGVIRYDGESFTHFTEKEGLMSNQVNSIFEDKEGILWFGTPNGVCSYDGKSFTPFPLHPFISGRSFMPDYSSEGLASDNIMSITQDLSGNMWFGTYGNPGNSGAYKFDGHTVTRYVPEFTVQGIVTDKEGGVWLDHQRYFKGSLNDLSGLNGIYKAAVFCSFKDRDDNLWFGVRSDGLYQYNGTSFRYFSEKDGLAESRISCIYQDKKGDFWLGSDIRFGTRKGFLCRYDGQQFTYYPGIYELGINSIWTIVEDRTGNLWIGGRGGKLCRYDGKNFTDFSEKIRSLK